ncbi:MAG TPA: hypothetical protein DCE33_01820 [Rhodospirillaceae bacterium]|nr:hypothetical protein [Rhodospirillaceae bacterium]
MKDIKPIVCAGALALSLSACQLLGDRDNQIAGATIAGTGAGVLLAAELYGTGTGGALAMFALGTVGAATGYYLAKKLLPQEKQAFNAAAYRSLENAKIGETVTWRDAETGNHGSFTPTREFTDKQGRVCRQLKSSITVHSDTANTEKAACRLHDSAWQAA